MTPYHRDPDCTYYVGDVREVAAALAEKSVHVAVCSPPYWGLRDYGIAPSVWGGDPECRHEWSITSSGDGKRKSKEETEANIARAEKKGYDVGAWGASRTAAEGFDRIGISASATCSLCSAWRGVLGLEPLPSCGRSEGGLLELRSDLTEEERDYVISELRKAGVL